MDIEAKLRELWSAGETEQAADVALGHLADTLQAVFEAFGRAKPAALAGWLASDAVLDVLRARFERLAQDVADARYATEPSARAGHFDRLYLALRDAAHPVSRLGSSYDMVASEALREAISAVSSHYDGAIQYTLTALRARESWLWCTLDGRDHRGRVVCVEPRGTSTWADWFAGRESEFELTPETAGEASPAWCVFVLPRTKDGRPYFRRIEGRDVIDLGYAARTDAGLTLDPDKAHYRAALAQAASVLLAAPTAKDAKPSNPAGLYDAHVGLHGYGTASWRGATWRLRREGHGDRQTWTVLQKRDRGEYNAFRVVIDRMNWTVVEAFGRGQFSDATAGEFAADLAPFAKDLAAKSVAREAERAAEQAAR